MNKNLIIIIIILLIIFILVFSINLYVYLKTKDKIINDYSKLKGYDTVIVLGSRVYKDKPSIILKDRLDKAIELYKKGYAKTIIMSGAKRKNNYDEAEVMKSYAIDNGVPEDIIIMDHYGYSTYDTIYRAKNTYNISKAIVVSQNYHLFRNIYIANKLDVDYIGVSAEKIKYKDRFYREIREVLARNKDFFKSILKPKSKNTKK